MRNWRQLHQQELQVRQNDIETQSCLSSPDQYVHLFIKIPPAALGNSWNIASLMGMEPPAQMETRLEILTNKHSEFLTNSDFSQMETYQQTTKASQQTTSEFIEHQQ